MLLEEKTVISLGLLEKAFIRRGSCGTVCRMGVSLMILL